MQRGGQEFESPRVHMEQDPFGKKKVQPYASFGQAEQISNEKKEILLQAFKAEVDEELKNDAKFNISQKWIDKIIREKPGAFLGIRNYTTIVKYYFGGELNNLRRKLNLPEIKPRNQL